MIDRYDGSQASDNPKPQDSAIGVLDRTMTALTGILLSPLMDYVRTDLGYVTKRADIPLSFLLKATFDRTSTVGPPTTWASPWRRTPTLRCWWCMAL